MHALRRRRLGLTAIGASVALMVVTGALGDSAAARSLHPGGPLPPYSVGAHPSAWLVTGLLVLAVLAGAGGTAACWWAARAGWRPRPAGLVAAGVVAAFALCLVPPVGSDDVYSYTAYGRMVSLGRDPYRTTPADLGADPVGRAAAAPWRDTASVYGPLATAEQAAVMRVAGDDVRTGVALLQVLAAAAFAATALLLHRAAADEDGRLRAALLFAVNPLLLLHLVGGVHVDVLVALLTVAAVISARRRPMVAGVLAGAAMTTKLSAGLVVAGIGWSLRRRSRRLTACLAVAAVTVGGAYLAVGGLRAAEPARHAARYVSRATPWRPVALVLDDVFGRSASRTIVAVGAAAVLVLLLPPLHRAVPGRDDDTGHRAAARAVAVPVLAWLLAASYALPWYDAALWCVLALLPWSRWDELLLARTTVLSLAYLPGRLVPLPPALVTTTHAVRNDIAPVALAALLGLALVLVRRARPLTALSAPP
ncbi:MAG: polyprenol phosphomannose-dependent alpha 1,6 mannosyltransferase MptB [Mycobacteriales bacterium]